MGEYSGAMERFIAELVFLCRKHNASLEHSNHGMSVILYSKKDPHRRDDELSVERIDGEGLVINTNYTFTPEEHGYRS
jgi:hypothetical protein